jgi:hypothetical protein
VAINGVTGSETLNILNREGAEHVKSAEQRFKLRGVPHLSLKVTDIPRRKEFDKARIDFL